MPKIKKNILITGASGHLGFIVLDKIFKKNYNIFALDTEEPKERKENIKYLIVDISDKNKLEKYKKIFKRIDVLIHLAAYVPLERKLDDLEKSINTNLKGSINLVSLLKKGSTFIFAGTCEVYRIFQHSKNISFYAISKLFAEKYLEIISKKRDIKFISLRFASIYGPGEKIQRAMPNFIKSAIKK